jgi:L-ascorbate metabolism protein UlaG (beta-lactamase superfamily)
MRDDRYFVQPNIIIEGLVDQFYAWSHLIAPATAAMNLANLHLPMLDSYVAQPHVHAAAVANPRMKGGFFVDCPSERAGEVGALRDRLARENATLLELAAAIRDTDELLRAQATGYDCTPLYAQVPEALRGYVELVYDLNNHPSLRLLEPALYRSRYHREERQSVELSLDDGRTRPFILSTPRLPDSGRLQLPLPLRHPGIDRLFAARHRPASLAELREALEIADDGTAAQLRGYLTGEPVRRDDRHVANGGRIRYFGHACLLLQSPTVNILVDPFISGQHAATDGRLTYVDLPDHLDFCLISHGHQDHIVLESLLQIRERTDLVVVPRTGGGLQDPSLKLVLGSLGFTVHEVDDFDVLPFEGGEIVATPFLGEHCDLDIRGKTTYWLRVGRKRIFVDADSSGIEPELYRHVAEAVGGADIAFLGMECDGAPLTWLYSALFTQQVSRKMSITRKLSGSNAAQAMAIVERLGASEAYVYAMGEEAWLQHVMATSYTPESYQLEQVARFLDECATRGIKGEHLLVSRSLRW